MKRLLVAAAALLGCLGAKAQFTIGAGYCNTTATEKVVQMEQARYIDHGVFVEAGYDAAINRRWSVLTLAQAGSYMARKDNGETSRIPGNHYYAKVPVYGKCVFASDTDLKLFCYLGPEFYWTLADNALGQFDLSYDRAGYHRYNVFIGGGVGCDVRNNLRIRFGLEGNLINPRINEDKRFANLSASYSDAVFGISYIF